MKRTILLLTGCALFSVLLVFELNYNASQVNHSKNGFIRLFPPHALSGQYVLSLPGNSYYIAGFSDGHLYIGNSADAAELLVTDLILATHNTIRLPVALDKKLAWKAVRTVVDSTNVFRTDAVTPSFSYGKLNHENFRFLNLAAFNFDQLTPISISSAIVRTYSIKDKQNVVQKLSFSPLLRKQQQYRLDKQIDGVFCTDGEMKYDPETATLLYMYYYRNRFILLDTNLKVLLDTKTIDTNSRAKLSISGYGSNKEKVVTFSSPANFVNQKCAMAAGNVYVYASLKADNEPIDEFNKFCVIDVYSMKNGSYLYSFYLPKYGGRKLTDFAVKGKTILVQYDKELLSFKINL